MDSFCGSTFWDKNISWYTEDPDLTPCFEKTILVWIPCLFLWIFTPLEVYYLYSSKYKDVPWNWLNISKFILIFLIICQCVVDFVYVLIKTGNDQQVYPVDIYTPIIKFVSFCLAATLLWYNRKKGQRSSGHIFLFYFLCTLCGAPRLRSIVRQALKDHELSDPVFIPISYIVFYCATVLSFLLNFFAEPEPKFSQYPIVKRLCPEKAASFLSKLTFSWFSPLARQGYRSPLKHHHLWHLNFEDTSKEVVPKFDKYWDALVHDKSLALNKNAAFLKQSENVNFQNNSNAFSSKKNQRVSILMPLCKAFGPTFIFGAFLKAIQDLLTFVHPQVLRLLIVFVSGKESMWKGYLFSILLLATATCQTLLLAQYFNRMSLVGLRIRTALISAVYRKALRVSNAARKESTVGEIVNLMSVDAQRFMDLTAYLNLIWSAPLQIALGVYFLWHILGPSVLAGLAVMIILIPLNAWVASKVRSLQIKQMKYKDERVKLMNEILSGIKVLKLYAWEPSYEQQVLKIREKEAKILKYTAYLNSSTYALWVFAPFIVSLVTFAVFVLSDPNNILDSETAFVSLSLFFILRFPLSMLPMLISNLVQTSVSVKRINKFMNLEELDPNCVQHSQTESDPIVVENGAFSWGGNQKEDVVLRNINIRVKQASLVAVVGTVGSGKSSLLSAILGEMEKIFGRVNTTGSIAYVPQQAWIQNATLKDNILFGRNFEQSNYTKVVRACALQSDLEMLPAGDSTEIGEKGVNLSGGQKQRVSLARAVYSNSDLYLLDDPLSAVDSHVGKHIFDNIIGPKGLLKKKTRVLVTHSVTYLPEVDLIIVLKDGQISESGTYKQLLDQKGAFSEFLMQYQLEEEQSTEITGLEEALHHFENSELLGSDIPRRSSHESISSSHSVHRRSSSDSRLLMVPAVVPGENLVEEEKAETGNVKKQVYLHYIKSIGAVLFIVILVLNVLFQISSVGANIWLSRWSSDKSIVVNGTLDVSKQNFYLYIYAAFGVGQCVLEFFADILLRLGMLVANQRLHSFILHAVLFAPLSFTDTTPIGRILSRFSKDIDVIDNQLPWEISDLIYCFFEVVSTLSVISFTTPIFIAIILPIGILYFFVQRFYVASSRQLKRLESVSRSPIYSHFGETIQGAASIRAYGVQERFISESEKRVDYNQVCLFPSLISNRWLAVRLEMVGNLIIFFSALFAVMGRETVDAGLVGLSVTYALQITQTLNWLVRMTSDVETNIVAVERIKEYGETPQEAAWEVTPGPPTSWPDKGQVEFRDYQVRYREGLDLVLKGVSFTVDGGEKVGIVGRTGAGKSSLTLCLFRILEAAGGQITIDNQDISKLGLGQLRSRLTIIPQDPVLFSGTLRMNMDPFNRESDGDLWHALELAHLKNFVKGLSSGLQHQVTEGGDNLSVGQRQLICLSRALLRKTKVLILDEATAAVDLETDDLIQQTIRSQFRDCTVLTIAHRLNTIMDYDRVLVLDKGSIVEFDSPTNLLKKNTSVFYGMAKDANLV